MHSFGLLIAIRATSRHSILYLYSILYSASYSGRS